ncbi:hypothetical protein CDAR_431361 [Caerostris darwini]|uniref:Secreted protein n=1 Tax=Caerostris darwini TaxID=1538125 RepID=A0AAV4RN09_9ARAC|nr:hypothetical protein CDAR_431361 [Caerostris darwini]
MTPRLDALSHLVFLVLPELLNKIHVSVSLRRSLCFQNDKALAHFILDIRRQLNVIFQKCWIGRGGMVGRPPRLPDLSCADFYLCKLMCMIPHLI